MLESLQADKNNYKVLGILIRSQRISKGYSLRDLGQVTNISHTLISNIEKGKQIPAPNTLADIFRVLDLEFFDDPKLQKELKKYSDDIYNNLFNHDYDLAKVSFKKLQKNEHKYLHSLGLVNFVLLKYFYLTITKTEDETIGETIEHYYKVLEFFSNTQKQLFYFIDGLYQLNNEHYNDATEKFNLALQFGDKEIDVFIKEYSVISYVRQYKFMDAYKLSQEIIKEFEARTIYIRAMKTKLQEARILYQITKNEETEVLVAYVDRFARKFKIDDLIEECAMLRAAIAIRLRDFEKAEYYINEIPNTEGISAVLLRFKIAFVQNNLDDIEKIYNEVIEYEEIKSHEKIRLYLTIQVMSKVEKYYDKKKYFEYITRLAEMSKRNMDQEMISIAHNYLIMYYHEERSYKKALDIAENLLHLKKIRIREDI